VCESTDFSPLFRIKNRVFEGYFYTYFFDLVISQFDDLMMYLASITKLSNRQIIKSDYLAKNFFT